MHRPKQFIILIAILVFFLVAESASLYKGWNDEGQTVAAIGEVALTLVYQRKDTNMVCLDGDMTPSSDPFYGDQSNCGMDDDDYSWDREHPYDGYLSGWIGGFPNGKAHDIKR